MTPPADATARLRHSKAALCGTRVKPSTKA